MLDETLSNPRYTGIRAMQSPADPNKVLVEIKTDSKPLRFFASYLSSRLIKTAGCLMLRNAS